MKHLGTIMIALLLLAAIKTLQDIRYEERIIDFEKAKRRKAWRD